MTYKETELSLGASKILSQEELADVIAAILADDCITDPALIAKIIQYAIQSLAKITVTKTLVESIAASLVQ